MSAVDRATPTHRGLSSTSLPFESDNSGADNTVRRPTKSWAKFKLQWIEQLEGDPELNSTTKIVGIAVMHFANSGTAEAWPTQETIAKRARVGEATARACLSKLIKRGHLKLGKLEHKNHNKYELQLFETSCDDYA